MVMAIEHPWRALGVILFAALVITSCVDELAYAKGPIFVSACSKTTCLAVVQGQPSKRVATSSIDAVYDSISCPLVCSVIHTSTAQYHIVGNWLDVVCQVWGGVTCKWDKRYAPKPTSGGSAE